MSSLVGVGFVTAASSLSLTIRVKHIPRMRAGQHGNMENGSERRGHTYPGNLGFPQAETAHLGDSFTTNIYRPSYEQSSLFDALWRLSTILRLQREPTWEDIWNVAARVPDHRSHPAHPKTQLASDQGDGRGWNSGTNPGRDGGTRPVTIGESAYKFAYEQAKKCWIEEGNWNDKYNDPYHQFVCQQIPRERKQIEGAAGISAANINSKAYKNVRMVWVSRGVWNNEWDPLPGMKWMHEEVRHKEITHSPIQANLPGNDSPEAVDARTQPVLESIQSNYYREPGDSGVKEVPQYALDGSANCEIEQPLLLSSSSTVRNSKQAPRPSTRPTPLPSRRKRFQRKDSQLTRVPLRRKPSSCSLARCPSADNVDELSLPFRDAS